MKMQNPFKKLPETENDREKQRLEKLMKEHSWTLTKNLAKGKATNNDIKNLEIVYKEYFEKYPNKEKEISCRNRIAKLKRILKLI